MDAKKFFKKLDSITDIPTLPTMVIQVNKMLQDYETSIGNLGKVIETDQAMVTKILRLVNSTFYGFRSKIKNINHAIIVLGFNTIRNAVVSVSIIKMFSGEKSSEGFDITDFWKHSIAVAVTSRYLSETTELDSPDDCFVAGLLHDIGKVVLSQYFDQLFEYIWKRAREEQVSFYKVEKEVLPVNHAQIGGHLAKNWQFPGSLIDSITHHHEINKGASNLHQLMIVHTADSIVNNHYVDPENRLTHSTPINSEAKSIILRNLGSISEWFPNVATEIESACEFFLAAEGQ
jgi:putative nucleotidyltransferase with HDIG domain